jgi:hypothetical protein
LLPEHVGWVAADDGDDEAGDGEGDDGKHEGVDCPAHGKAVVEAGVESEEAEFYETHCCAVEEAAAPDGLMMLAWDWLFIRAARTSSMDS